MEQNSTLTALHISGNNASDATVRALKKSIARNRKSHNLTTKGNITNTTNGNSGNNGNRNAALSLESKDASSSKQEEENTVRTPLDPESLEVRQNLLSVLHRLMH